MNSPQEKYKAALDRIQASLKVNTLELDDVDAALDALGDYEAMLLQKIQDHEELLNRLNRYSQNIVFSKETQVYPKKLHDLLAAISEVSIKGKLTKKSDRQILKSCTPTQPK